MERLADEHLDREPGQPLGNQPVITDNELEAWQSIVDLAAQIAGVRAGLIMRLQNGEIEALVVSRTRDNPYTAGSREHFDHSGLYCEAVIRENAMLLVPNALKSDAWAKNPDIAYGMLSYLGFPIHLPDGSPFGTICILDDKENDFSPSVIALMEKMRDMIQTHLKLLLLSAYDQLTGLYNRASFRREAFKEMKRADRYGEPITLLILDIDHFKTVNDTSGHLAGDEVLRTLARIMASALRSTDIVARYGGEEFAVLMPNTEVGSALAVAERLRARLERAPWPAGAAITASIGADEYIPGDAFDDWFRRADTALYRAKNSGRNQVAAYDRRDGVPVPIVRLVWKNAWNSGNAQIDREHQKIIELGNRLVNSALAGREHGSVLAQLELLLQHILAHFDSEVDILSRIGYPQCREHEALHQDLIARSLSLKEAYMNRGIKSSAFFSFIIDDVVVGHMEQEDSKFFPYTAGHPEAGS